MNADRLLAHYKRIADAPDAIARLRRFILDLAVRGKLVPQDPKDEPASELLKRIAGETARLVKKKGEIKKPGTPPQLAKDEVWPVPPSWAFIPLELLAAPAGLFADGDWVESKNQDPNGGVRLTQLADVGVGEYRDRSSRFMNAATAARLNCTFLTPGDILIARMPDPLGRACIFPGDPKPSVTVVDVAVLRLGSHDFVASYVVLAINSPQFARNVEAKAAGTTRSRISRGNLSLLPFPLPPLAEQNRIVAKVDELMALCDRLETARTAREATRDRLAAASLARLNAPDHETFQADARFVLKALPALTTRPDHIKQLRQTILNLAVRGKLVAQDANDEPASELLKRIAKEKTRPQAIKKARRKGETEISSLRADTSLSTGWRWTNIDEIALSMRYGTSTKCEYGAPGVPVLRIPNVSGGFVSLDDIKFGPLTDGEVRDLALSAGDLLLIRSNGSLDIVGRSAIVTLEAEGMAFAGYLVRLRLSLSNVNPKYVWLALNSTDVREQIERPIRSAVGLKNVNLTEFGALTFPLPPLAEQHRIVAKVDALMALCDQLEAGLSATSVTRFRLLNSLLAEALAPASTVTKAAAE
jgi:type I restriction enzyme, S subunit